MQILLLGDIAPTAVTSPLFQTGKVSALFGNTIDLFHGQDAVIANLECALTLRTDPIIKIGPHLQGPPETAAVLRRLGVTHCSLSNNHTFDFGESGLADTVQALTAHGIGYTGIGKNADAARKNLVLHRDGFTVCVIAVCEHEYSFATDTRAGARAFDPYDTLKDVRTAAQQFDRVLVLYHGGKEFCRYPSPRLRKLCRAMAENGADAILCQHSHCIGCHELYNNCHIVYGQGNFHFVKPHRFDGWHSGLAIQYTAAANTIKCIPCIAETTGIRLASDDEATQILNTFQTRSQKLQTHAWKSEWQQFCDENRDGYMQVIKNAWDTDTNAPSEAFAHNLICEAHYDVLRTLCPTAHEKTYTK